MSRRSGACLRICLVIFAVVSALGVCGPAIYWKFKKDMRLKGYSSSKSCPPCACDCPSPLSLLKIAPGLANLSISDCGRSDPELKQEMEKHFVDLLAEELKLQDAVSQEHGRHMNITFAEAKRVASQYQKEAEKCNAATEICEEARERAEAQLRKERKVTLMWEKRARQVGWEGERRPDIVPFGDFITLLSYCSLIRTFHIGIRYVITRQCCLTQSGSKE